MPEATLVAGIVTALVVDAALLLALLVVAVRRRQARAEGTGVGVFPAASPEITAALAERDGSLDASPRGTYDRVVRVTTWSFLLSTGVIVASTGLWPTSQGALLAILAIAGLFVIIAHDVLPAATLGRALYIVEGLVAIVIVSLVVLLTGAARSPFFFAFVLVVAGGALAIPPAATVLLTGAAAVGYLAVSATTLASGGLDPAGAAQIAINLAALVMLSYVAMVVGREQRRSRDAAIRLSTTDALTGLANRAFVLAAVDREIERATRFGRGFCLLMADVDDLKLINDTYGHRLGDRVLVAVAGVIRDGIRRIDIPARLGGDEFVVLLPETDPSGAFVAAEKIRLGIREIEATMHDKRVRVSVSIGLVAFPEDGISRDELVVAVDDAMYASKRKGKDRVGGPTGSSTSGGAPVDSDARDENGARSAGRDRATGRPTSVPGVGERAG